MFRKIAQNGIKTEKSNFARIEVCEWLRKVLFLAKKFNATKAKIFAFFRKNCAKFLQMETLLTPL